MAEIEPRKRERVIDRGHNSETIHNEICFVWLHNLSVYSVVSISSFANFDEIETHSNPPKEKKTAYRYMSNSVCMSFKTRFGAYYYNFIAIQR